MKSVRGSLNSGAHYPDPVLTRPYYFTPAWGDLNLFWTGFWEHITVPVRAGIEPTAMAR